MYDHDAFVAHSSVARNIVLKNKISHWLSVLFFADSSRAKKIEYDTLNLRDD